MVELRTFCACVCKKGNIVCKLQAKQTQKCELLLLPFIAITITITITFTAQGRQGEKRKQAIYLSSQKNAKALHTFLYGA